MTAAIIHAVTGAPLAAEQLAEADPDRVPSTWPSLSEMFRDARHRGVAVPVQLWDRVRGDR